MIRFGKMGGGGLFFFINEEDEYFYPSLSNNFNKCNKKAVFMKKKQLNLGIYKT